MADKMPWLMFVDDMTYEKAQEAGRALGAIGVTGRFTSRTFAESMAEFGRLRGEVERLRKENERLRWELAGKERHGR